MTFLSSLAFCLRSLWLVLVGCEHLLPVYAVLREIKEKCEHLWHLTGCHAAILSHNPDVLSSHVCWFLLMHVRTSAESLSTYHCVTNAAPKMSPFSHVSAAVKITWYHRVRCILSSLFPLSFMVEWLHWCRHIGIWTYRNVYNVSAVQRCWDLERVPRLRCGSITPPARTGRGPEPEGPSLFFDFNYESNKIEGLLETFSWPCNTETPFSFGPICFNSVLSDLIRRDEDACSSTCDGRPLVIW